MELNQTNASAHYNDVSTSFYSLQERFFNYTQLLLKSRSELQLLSDKAHHQLQEVSRLSRLSLDEIWNFLSSQTQAQREQDLLLVGQLGEQGEGLQEVQRFMRGLLVRTQRLEEEVGRY